MMGHPPGTLMFFVSVGTSSLGIQGQGGKTGEITAPIAQMATDMMLCLLDMHVRRWLHSCILGAAPAGLQGEIPRRETQQPSGRIISLHDD